MKIRFSFWILILILVILIIAQAFIKDLAFERSIYFVLFLLVVAWLITKKSIYKCTVTRKTRENRQQVGQVLKERFEFINDSSFPKMWVSIHDLSEIHTNSEIRLLSWVSPKSKFSYVTQTQIKHRGKFDLGPVEIRSGDPFGIFVQSKKIEAKGKLLVIPIYEKLDFFPHPAGLLMGGNVKKTRHLEVSPYAISVREYAPGDPLRRIDWKSTARLDKLMVKEFEQDPQSIIWVILDGNENNHFLKEEIKINLSSDQFLIRTLEQNNEILPCDTFEYSVSFAASVCNYYISQGKTVGFCSNSQQTLVLVPERGARQVDKILESLALVQPRSEVSLKQFVESQMNQMKKGTTVVIISSTNKPEISGSLETMKKRGLYPIFLSINSASFGSGEGNGNLITELLASEIYTLSIEYNEHLSQKISYKP
jgi:uncharacterized protein (DUF58 family)